jgi:2',3'-cyclic-nucleotide 2'-phosphodiesterase/3'-nucleotidase
LRALVDPAFPAFAFEPIHGLSYTIDLTAPARFDAQGRLTDPAARRIRDLRWNGRPVDPGMRFAVATNSHRASLLAEQTDHAVLDRLDRAILSRDVLAAWLATSPGLRHWPMAEGGWSLAPLGGHPVLFDTGPGAARHLGRIAGLCPEVRGTTPSGFLQLRLVL